jgi:hypothetical protein
MKGTWNHRDNYQISSQLMKEDKEMLLSGFARRVAAALRGLAAERKRRRSWRNVLETPVYVETTTTLLTRRSEASLPNVSLFGR